MNNNKMNSNININESSLGLSIFLLTASIVFSVYASTASHSIAGGDSGELVAEGCQLGTSHPPGYPLYTVIVYLVTSFGKQFYPTLSPAYLVNITSCLFGSISCGLLSLIVYKLTSVVAAVVTQRKDYQHHQSQQDVPLPYQLVFYQHSLP